MDEITAGQTTASQTNFDHRRRNEDNDDDGDRNDRGEGGGDDRRGRGGGGPYPRNTKTSAADTKPKKLCYSHVDTFTVSRIHVNNV